MEKIKTFFVDLYHKFVNLSWVRWTIDYCKEKPLWAGLIGGLALFILVMIFVMIGVSSKRKKAAHKATEITFAEVVEAPAKTEPAKAEVKAEPAKAEVKAEPVVAPVKAEVQPEPIKVEVKPEPVKEPEPVVEVKPEPIKAEPVKEEVKEEVKAEPVAKATPVKEEKVEKELAPAAPAKKSAKAQEVEDALAMVENVDESKPEALRDNYDENETDRIARYKGKWVICRVLTDEEDSEEMYFFELRASNGEKLLSSEEYTTYQGALRGIQTHKTNILKGNLKITVSKKGDYIFKLLSGKNLLLCMGENYPTRARCESAMDSTIRFGATAVIDENVQDIVVKVPKEDDSPIAPLPENCNGKWIISSGESAEGEKIYYFELFANNGEKLLGSEEYTTYIGAVNGIQTHKKNVEKDNFRISLTKRGDYIYKLLNGNGQLLCLGEHYKTKRLCQNAVESVKRFALNAPVLTDSEEKK